MNDLKITGWVVEYWNPVSRNVSYFSSLDGSWVSAPSKDVIYVWFFTGPYITVLQGTDYFFFTGEIFGGYNNAIVSPTSVDYPGRYFQIVKGEVVATKTPKHTKPFFVMDWEIKEGVWVTEPCATKLGFSDNKTGPRKTPELRRYTS